MTPDLESIYETESRHVLATLIRLLGDLDVAEDALHEAFLAAAEQWPREGVPHNPRSWLISTGRFQAIDAIRRRARYDVSLRRLAQQSHLSEELDVDLDHMPDDDLRLMLLCCHPALSLDSQIALTLREAGGLTTEEIAQAYVAKPSAIAQRIVRAKAKIRDAGIPFDLPIQTEFPPRLRGLLHVMYLLFNEGYEASFGETLVRVDLCAEAIRLTRLIIEIRHDGEACGLLALMLFHHARRNARTGPSGELVLLDDQDRSNWDRIAIAEARSFLRQAHRSESMGRYTCQASIVEAHIEPSGPQQTDWNRIVHLYDVLLELDPSPIVGLNRAVAIAMWNGPAAGLAIMEELLADGKLNDYRFAHAARADMYRRLGRADEARSAYESALALTTQAAERRFIAGRIAELANDSV